MMASAVGLSVVSLVPSWGCPISIRVVRVMVPFLAMMKVVPNYYSSMDYTPCLRAVEMQRSVPLARGGALLLMLFSRK
jgi:hypothetical protein